MIKKEKVEVKTSVYLLFFRYSHQTLFLEYDVFID